MHDEIFGSSQAPGVFRAESTSIAPEALEKSAIWTGFAGWTKLDRGEVLQKPRLTTRDANQRVQRGRFSRGLKGQLPKLVRCQATFVVLVSPLTRGATGLIMCFSCFPWPIVAETLFTF